MKTVIGIILLSVVFSIGISNLANAQNPYSSYAIPGNLIRGQYDLAISSWQNGNYVNAYATLLFFYYANDMSGNFNQNQQFKKQVEQALYDLGDYVGKAVRERDTLRNQLQVCQQSAQGGGQTRGISSVIARTPINRLPQTSPLQ